MRSREGKRGIDIGQAVSYNDSETSGLDNQEIFNSEREVKGAETPAAPLHGECILIQCQCDSSRIDCVRGLKLEGRRFCPLAWSGQKRWSKIRRQGENCLKSIALE